MKGEKRFKSGVQVHLNNTILKIDSKKMVDVKRYKLLKLKQHLKIAEQYERKILQSKTKLDKVHQKLAVALSKVDGKIQFLRVKKRLETEVNQQILALAKQLTLIEAEINKAQSKVRIPRSKERKLVATLTKKMQAQKASLPSISSQDLRRIKEIEKKKAALIKRIRGMLQKEIKFRDSDLLVIRKIQIKFKKRMDMMRDNIAKLSKEKSALLAEKKALSFEQSKLRAELTTLRREQNIVRRHLQAVTPRKKAKKKRRKR